MVIRTRPLSRRFWAIVALALALHPLRAAHAETTSDSSLDETDQQARHDALDQVLAAAPGAEESWSNINSGHRGAFRSLSERPSEGGQICRDVAETVWFQDGRESGILVACRAGGDPWKVVSASLRPVTETPPETAPVSQPPGLGNLPVQVWVGAPRNGAGTVVVPQPGPGTP